MSSPRGDYRSLRDPLVITATAAALVIRVFNCDAAALWLDEIISAEWARLPWIEGFGRVLSDNHLPLHPLVLKAWTTVAGHSSAALRIPSVLASTAAVPVVASCAALLAGRQAARWAACFTAVSPYLLHHAQEARMYPFIALLAAVNFYAVLRYVSGESQRPGTTFWLSNLALLATHYYGAFVVVAGIAAVVLIKPADWRNWAGACAVSAAAILGPLTVFILMARHDSGAQYDLGFAALPGAIWTMVGGYALIPSSEEVHSGGLQAALPYLPFAAAGALALALSVVSALRRLAAERLYSCVVIAVVVFAGPFAAYVVGSDISINPRYLTGGTPVFIAVIAVGCAAATHLRSGWALPLVIASIMSVGAARHLGDPGHGREDIDPVSAWLTDRVSGEETVLVTSGEMAVILHYHAPGHRLMTHPPSSLTIDPSNVEAECSRLPVKDGTSRVVYIFGRSWVSDPEGLMEECIQQRYRVSDSLSVRGIRLYELTIEG